jgi:hypothetical protein
MPRYPVIFACKQPGGIAGLSGKSWSRASGSFAHVEPSSTAFCLRQYRRSCGAEKQPFQMPRWFCRASSAGRLATGSLRTSARADRPAGFQLRISPRGARGGTSLRACRRRTGAGRGRKGNRPAGGRASRHESSSPGVKNCIVTVGHRLFQQHRHKGDIRLSAFIRSPH